MKTTLFLLLFFVLTACSHTPPREVDIVTTEITYEADGKKMVGFIAKPAGVEKAPGVLVVHEWWGQTDYPRNRAKMLAQLGYVAMAVDMYGGKKTLEHPKEAGQFSKSVMKDAKTVGTRFKAALEQLQSRDDVDKENIAAIGYCFGGAVVLEMAKQGTDLNSVVSFHGALQSPTKAEKGKIKAEILVLHGADDKFIPDSVVESFKQEMQAADANMEFVSYPGALHGFTNPEASLKGGKLGIPLAYDAEADKASWEKMKQFLDRTLD